MFWVHSSKVLAQRIRHRDYTISMTHQGTETRVTTFHSETCNVSSVCLCLCLCVCVCGCVRACVWVCEHSVYLKLCVKGPFRINIQGHPFICTELSVQITNINENIHPCIQVSVVCFCLYRGRLSVRVPTSISTLVMTKLPFELKKLSRACRPNKTKWRLLTSFSN